MSNDEQSLDERLKAAGMSSIDQVVNGSPLDKFMTHAGVKDLETFEEWLMMRRKEMARMHARMELDGEQDHDLYEWVISHNAVLAEVLVNFRAATKQQ